MEKLVEPITPKMGIAIENLCKRLLEISKNKVFVADSNYNLRMQTS
jgi:hypothetical protein